MKTAKMVVIIFLTIFMVSGLILGCSSGGGGDGGGATEPSHTPTATPTTRPLVVVGEPGVQVECLDVTEAADTSRLVVATNENGEAVFEGLFVDHDYFVFADGIGSITATISENGENIVTVGASGTLIVTVMNSDENTVTNVSVTVGNETQTTNAYGQAFFAGLDEGNYLVAASATGYIPQEFTIQVVNGEKTEKEVVLEKDPEPTPSPTMTITPTPTPTTTTSPSPSPTGTPTPTPTPSPSSTPGDATIIVNLNTDAEQATGQIRKGGVPEGDPQEMTKIGEGKFKTTFLNRTTGDSIIRIFGLGEGYNTTYSYPRPIIEGINEFTFSIYK